MFDKIILSLYGAGLIVLCAWRSTNIPFFVYISNQESMILYLFSFIFIIMTMIMILFLYNNYNKLVI